MEAGEVVGKDCVDRHTLFITPLSSSRRRSAFASHHQAQPLPQPRPARTATEAWLGGTSSSSSILNSALRSSSAYAAQKGCGSGAPRGICEAGREKNQSWWRSRAPFSACTLKLAPPRTLPHVRPATPMSFHRVLRASAPRVHASWSRAPSSTAAARSVRGAVASPAADSDPCMFSTE